MIITNENSNKLAWDKMDNLLPAIVQDALSGKVLMQGYMDQDALTRTFETGKVTFFSRSKQRLWTKGETSGNTLDLVSVACDCDQDSLLVLANPNGPTCHTGVAAPLGGPAPAHQHQARLVDVPKSSSRALYVFSPQ